MSKLILLNKPFNVQCKFTDEQNRPTLKDFCTVPDVYAAGRLDADSEGLLVLSDTGWLQNLIAHPQFKLPKTYIVQVEGSITEDAIVQLCKGVVLKDGLTKPAECTLIDEPLWLWERTPAVRFRAAIPTSWISLTIREGRNRQVRRMTAHVGFPTLRLIRTQIGPWSIDGIASGSWKEEVPFKSQSEAEGLFSKWVDNRGETRKVSRGGGDRKNRHSAEDSSKKHRHNSSQKRL